MHYFTHTTDRDGFVVVTGLTEDAKKSIVAKTVKVGDRIVAVDSTIGNKMWPVSNVEGLVSACTTRLPGNPVKLLFDRVVNVGEFNSDSSLLGTESENSSSGLVGAVDGYRQLKDTADTATVSGAPVSIKSIGSNTHNLLLSRSRDLLRRYMNDQSDQSASKSALSALPAVVADRVLEALADASAPLDSKTLNLIMSAYTSCRMPDKVIRAFEAATGVSADGSINRVERIIEGKKDGSILVADLNSLDLYTGTSLLRAHALKGDYEAAQRVLAAMEGRAGTLVNGVASISWPMQENTDIRCYNIALAAATKSGDKRGIDAAIEIFEGIENQSRISKPGKSDDSITKNRVTYNTLIAAFAKSKRAQDALTIFYSMKQAGIKPDKYTYTSLLKALVADGDTEGGEELLQEMRSVGIEADVVTYNTMIKGYCDRLQWYRAKEYVTIMETNGISPNSLTYGLLMNGLIKANKPSTCLTLFEAACADVRTMSIMENVHLYTTAITAASRLSDYERAVELVARMKKVGVKPNLKTLTSLMSACMASNNIQQAIDVYCQALQISKGSHSFQADGTMLTLAIKAFSEKGEFMEASKILSEQKDGYHQMSGKDIMFSYNYLITAALKNKDFEVARSSMVSILCIRIQ